MAIGATARYGYEASFGVAEETTFGTKVDSFSFMEFNSESLKHNREEIKIESINKSQDYIKRIMGNDIVEGAVEFFLNPAEDGQIKILKQAMGGTVTSSTVTAGSLNHTIRTGNMEYNKSTSGAANIKALNFQVSMGLTTTEIQTWDFLGCRVNTLSIKGEVGAPVVCTAEVVGQTASFTASVPTAVFSNVKPVNFVGVQVQTGDSITNVSAETFISFELTINNNLVSDANARGLGSRSLAILPPTRREVMLTLTQRYDTTQSYSRFTSETMTGIKIICDSQQTITAGGTTYSMDINLPACYFNNNSLPDIGDVGVLTHDLEVSAIKENTTSSYSVQMIARNATQTY